MLNNNPTLFKPLITYFSTLIDWTAEEINDFTDRLEIRQYKKNDLLLREGDIADGYFFINQGFCRIYQLINNKEKTYHFVAQGDFTTNIDSILLSEPSLWNLQAIKKTEAVFIPFEAAQWAQANLTEGEKLLRKLWEKYCIAKTTEIFSFYHINPLLRYQNLISLFPDINQWCSQKMIASYLNCTPEHYSMLKAKAIK